MLILALYPNLFNVSYAIKNHTSEYHKIKSRCDRECDKSKFDATGGLDHYIHQQAGNELDENCRKLKRLEVGQACLTSGYNLSTYIIHTFGPIWHGNQDHEEEKLRSCYINSLELASQYQLNSIAFPLISTRTNQYPK